jgi:hypothetical protein
MNYLNSSRLRNFNVYEQFEKDELLKQRRFQASKRLSSKMTSIDPEVKKEQSPMKQETALNRENLKKLEELQEQ